MCYPMVKKPKKIPGFIEMKPEKRNFSIFQKHERKNVLLAYRKPNRHL